MPSAMTFIVSRGEMTAHAVIAVICRKSWHIASEKKMVPSYIIATNRRLFDNDDSASIANDETNTCTAANSVIAGIRKRWSARNFVLPANSICRTSSSIAGTHVTNASTTASVVSLPTMYSRRGTGLEGEAVEAVRT